MLEIKNLIAGYGEKEVLQNLNLLFEKKALYAILGPNGSGKSTLLRTIDRIIKPKGGSIYISGEDLKKISHRNLAKRIAYLPQKSNSTPFCTVFDTILLGRKPHITIEPSKKDLNIVENLIIEFGLEEFAFRKIGELSGGESQKVLIARAISQEPEVLLLDEPVNHLDPKNQLEILSLLKRVTVERSIITIIVLHDLNLAIQFADYFIFMKNGKIYREGDQNIIDESLIKDVYEINVKIINHEGRKFVVNAF